MHTFHNRDEVCKYQSVYQPIPSPCQNLILNTHSALKVHLRIESDQRLDVFHLRDAVVTLLNHLKSEAKKEFVNVESCISMLIKCKKRKLNTPCLEVLKL